MRKDIQTIVCSCILLFFSASTASANVDGAVFSEAFDTDLSQWEPIRDDGRYWKVIDHKLEAYIPFGSTITELIPNSISMKPIENYVFELDYIPLEGADRNISFGVIDTNNWYEIHFAPHATYLVKVQNGKVSWSNSHPYILKNGSTYRISIVFIKGQIKLLINGQQVVEMTDPSYIKTVGNIAVKATTGGIFPTKVRFDNVLVRGVTAVPQNEDTQLGVTLLKQSDSRWAEQEYDTASDWSAALSAGSTIKEWGCNMVSLVMLLHYHGITQLPDGTAINPLSLNQWLLTNSGFYGDPPSGNIKRHSISVLSAEISKIHSTPKLEFKYVGENLLQTAITEIEKGNPVILELEGHFVIADGFTQDKSDLYIKDPGYSIEKLSAHPLALKSVRLFTPSQTDLSYISVISDPNVTVNLIDAIQYKEQTRLLSESKVILTPATHITELSKPANQQYHISFVNDSSTKKSVTVDTYTSDGQQQHFLLSISPGEQVFTLQFDKNGNNVISQKKDVTFSYKDLKKTIIHLSDINQIKQVYVKKILLRLISHAETVSVSDQKKILKVVKTIISFSPPSHITKAAQALLLDQVTFLMAALKR
ncbi:MAG: Peptidase 2 protein [Patescibacteria group bacterium]|nr:Peptidase 2 protein [Patescibacteria group bacterium]